MGLLEGVPYVALHEARVGVPPVGRDQVAALRERVAAITLKDGVVELKRRATGEKDSLALDAALGKLIG